MSVDALFLAECRRCKATFTGSYDSSHGGGPWELCPDCGRVDVEKACDCPSPTRRWRFDDCPLCLGPIDIEERLLPAY